MTHLATPTADIIGNGALLRRWSKLQPGRQRSQIEALLAERDRYPAWGPSGALLVTIPDDED